MTMTRPAKPRLARSMLFWAAILVTVLAFWPRGKSTSVELNYTDFVSRLEQGEIRSARIRDGRSVQGDLAKGEEAPSRYSVDLPVPNSEELVGRLVAANVTVEALPPRMSATEVALGLLPWVLILGFLFWLHKRSAGGGLFQLTQSRAKVMSPDMPHVTFADVAGIDEAKADLQEIVEILRDPARFVALGARLPKGVLLVGPPGTGKTMLARAVAGEAGRAFYSISGSDFIEMIVGVGAARVRALFEQAKASAPCIVFIDEIDAVGRQRGVGISGAGDEREQTLNQLLVEMDGFEPTQGVILLAATNRPDVLDPALLRPGRFDRQVYVGPPDVRGREAILRVHAQRMPMADDVDLARIARATPGMSGADLANMLNEAALLAARDASGEVSQAHVEQARDRVLMGTERKSMVLSAHERHLTAVHEAGHALIALRVPRLDPLHKVTIIPRGQALGITASLPEEDRHTHSKARLRAHLVMLFGGRVAEEIVFGPDEVTTGAGDDLKRATAIARMMVLRFGMSDRVGPVFLDDEGPHRAEMAPGTATMVDTEVRRILEDAQADAHRIISRDRRLLDRMTEALLEMETLERAHLEAMAADEGGKGPDLEF
jgi:cell division protease FtsH